MTLAYWCVLIAGLLPYFTVLAAKRSKQYDNAEPRAWLERQQGMQRRANYAHLNGFEAFPLFAAAVIIAQQLRAPQHWIDALALAFILLRFAYILLYVGNQASLRSIVWFLGFACTIAIFLLAAFR